MSRVPKTKSKLEALRARQKAPPEVTFNAAPGTRLLAGGMCAILAGMFLIHQTQIDGLAPFLRAGSALIAAFFAVLAWYFIRRGSRRGPVLHLDKHGFGMALGFNGWIEMPWDEVEAFRYWEPTGIAFLVKRRQSRWVGIVLRHGLKRETLTWDQHFEIRLNTIHNRPGLCILHPFVDASILDVLQAFKDHAPRELDDYEWMSR
ncbi:MAG: hypothetical protein AAF409_08715 [Pseudomonadota bacterium]